MILSRNIFVQYRVVNGVKYISKNYEVFQLDEVGSQVWEAIDGKVSIEEISKRIADNYNVEYDMVFNDVNSFAQSLVEKELAEVV